MYARTYVLPFGSTSSRVAIRALLVVPFLVSIDITTVVGVAVERPNNQTIPFSRPYTTSVIDWLAG